MRFNANQLKQTIREEKSEHSSDQQDEYENYGSDLRS